MTNTTILNACNAMRNAMLANPFWHVGSHADGSPMLDLDALYQELVDARIGGWLGLPEVDLCTLGEWSGAIELLIKQERSKVVIRDADIDEHDEGDLDPDHWDIDQ